MAAKPDTAITLTNNTHGMKHLTLFACLIVTLMLIACGSTKNVNTTALIRAEADTLFASGNYSAALEKYQSIVPQEGLADSVLCRQITIAARKVSNFTLACQYGLTYSSAGDCEKLEAIATSLDSTSRSEEAMPLIENNRECFYSTIGREATIEKLALYYNKTKSEKLIAIYDEIEQPTVRSECFANYFQMVRDGLDDINCKKLCMSALTDNQEQIPALRYLAISLYNMAESRYKTAMDEYNRNKNNTTYAYLRRDLKRISAIYVDSKGYFEKIHKLNPDDKSTIKYLVNIYNRLDKPEVAKSYERLLK